MGHLLHHSGLSSASQPKALSPILLCHHTLFSAEHFPCPEIGFLFICLLVYCLSPFLWPMISTRPRVFSDVFLQLLVHCRLQTSVSKLFVEWLKPLGVTLQQIYQICRWSFIYQNEIYCLDLSWLYRHTTCKKGRLELSLRNSLSLTERARHYTQFVYSMI